jgi:hypothetical protein
MTQSRKDQDAEAAIKAAIRDQFKADQIDEIAVFPAEDQGGEPALSVTITLKAAQKRMSGARLLDTIAASASALREIDDYRFPYVTFLTTEDDSAEDTRPAA